MTIQKYCSGASSTKQTEQKARRQMRYILAIVILSLTIGCGSSGNEPNFTSTDTSTSTSTNTDPLPASCMAMMDGVPVPGSRVWLGNYIDVCSVVPIGDPSNSWYFITTGINEAVKGDPGKNSIDNVFGYAYRTDQAFMPDTIVPSSITTLGWMSGPCFYIKKSYAAAGTDANTTNRAPILSGIASEPASDGSITITGGSVTATCNSSSLMNVPSHDPRH